LGASGTGKTTFALRYLLNSQARVVFLYDPIGEFSSRLKIPAATNGFGLNTSLLSGWVCFDPSELFPGQRQAGFDFFCEYAFAVSERFTGRKIFVVDEVQDYLAPQSIPQELADIAEKGRKRELEIVAMSQRPNEVNGAFINQATEIVCFGLGSVNDAKKLEGYGFNAEEIRALPDRAFIARTRRGGETRGVIP
jgi:hypothetical protein